LADVAVEGIHDRKGASMASGVSIGGADGVLGWYASGFGAHLVTQGYARSSVYGQLRLLAELSDWLVEHGIEPAALTAEVAARFVHARRERSVYVSGPRVLDPLLGYLRGLGAVPDAPVVADTPVERLVAHYREYLARERGLVAGSIDRYEHVARSFLAQLPAPIEPALRELQPRDVTAFVVAECRTGRRAPAAGKLLTSGLRSLLRFLHLAGWVPVPLAQAVPSVAGWRLSALPRALEPAQVRRLLEACDRGTVLGRRNFAVLTLLSRLGLRSCEVAALSLDAIDWRAGELTIRGKASRTERLPLPHDVGSALVGYLRDGRPLSSFREVFLRVRAPYCPLSPGSIHGVVRDSCDRAGLPRVGAHRLRHTVASELLRAGAPLEHISPILRHASLESTAIYAKVDREALRTLARPWPVAECAA
jgi:integrase/recombinase XerD